MRILQTRKRLIDTINKLRVQKQQIIHEKDEKINEMQLEIEAQILHGDVMKKKFRDEIEFLEKVIASEEESYLDDVAKMSVQIKKLREENEELQEYKYRYLSFVKNRRIRS